MFSHDLPATGPEAKAYAPLFIHNLFPIESEIVVRLYALSVEAYGPNAASDWHSDQYWTHRLINTLYDLGTREGYVVFPTKGKETGKFQSQWLFDVVWVDAKPNGKAHEFDWRGARSLKLACESEWATSEEAILEDFLKLTFALADLRLFIYTNRSVKTEDGMRHPADICRKVCPLSHGFRYLLVGFPTNAGDQFRVDSWVA